MNGHYLSTAFLMMLLSLIGGVAAASTIDHPPSATLALMTEAVPPAHPEKIMLMAITMAGERMVTVGEHGAIAYSDDEGQTWHSAKRVPVSVTLTDVAFASPKVGWAIGHQGVVLRTKDAGQTWERQADGVSLAQIALGYWARESAAGNPDAEAALKDARYLVEDGPEKPLLSLLVDDEHHLTIVGAFGIAFKSFDGGKSWLPVTSLQNEGRLHLYGIAQMSAGTLIVGEQGLLLSDGRALPSPYEGSFFGVVSDSKSGAVAYGLRGNLAISTDGGEGWRAKQVGQAAFTSGIRLENGLLLLGNQAGQVFVSQDMGNTFRKVQWQAHAPLTAAVQAANGDVVFSSLAGVARLSASELPSPLEQNVGLRQ